mmetsp:Transcript_6388/g.24023  ORF Transcript_6388/g.24023 Transcript_6388/m.24023 type:complete len:81 (+) Transcript_6388:174-416(+)
MYSIPKGHICLHFLKKESTMTQENKDELSQMMNNSWVQLRTNKTSIYSAFLWPTMTHNTHIAPKRPQGCSLISHFVFITS